MTDIRHKPLPSRQHFVLRLGRNAAIAAIIVSVSLLVGMTGYIGFEGMSTVDGFVNAAMILSGMGPIQELHTTGGKIFAGCYALFSGVVFITTAAVLLAPMVHRFLHRFHLDISA